MESPTETTEAQYYEAFNQANPGLKDSNQGYNIFKQVYDENIKNKKHHSEVRAKEVFGKALDDATIKKYVTTLTGTSDDRALDAVEHDVANWDIEMVKRRLASLEEMSHLSEYQKMQVQTLKARLANEKK